MPTATNARDSATIYFEDDGGAGPPVVIMGGFLDTIPIVRTTSIPQALVRHGGFRLVFVDHRGHGRSDAPHDPAAYEMSLRVADVVAVLDHLGIDRAHIVGTSWGGRLAFGVGEHAPERVRSLVTVGQQPYEIDPDGPLARLVGEALRDGDSIEPLVRAFESVTGRYPDDLRSVYLASDPVAMRAAFSAAQHEGAVARDLSAWRVPCLICVAEDDADFADQARRAAEQIPDARFVVIPGTDHLGADTAAVDPVLPAILELFERT